MQLLELLGIVLLLKWRGFSTWDAMMSFLMFHTATQEDTAIQLTRK